MAEARGAASVLLRVEGAVVLLAAGTAYAQLGQGWPLFAALFLVPDLSLLAYLAGPRVGAAAYNAAHSHLGPAALAGAGWLLAAPAAGAVALVWFAHIGFDRALGFGLKNGADFRSTHLGRLGRADPW